MTNVETRMTNVNWHRDLGNAVLYAATLIPFVIRI